MLRPPALRPPVLCVPPSLLDASLCFSHSLLCFSHAPLDPPVVVVVCRVMTLGEMTKRAGHGRYTSVDQFRWGGWVNNWVGGREAREP